MFPPQHFNRIGPSSNGTAKTDKGPNIPLSSVSPIFHSTTTA